MIVADTSALIAILFREPEGEAFAMRIARERSVLIAAPTAFEFRLVTLNKGGRLALADADLMIENQPFEIVAWQPDHVSIATDALQRFGKGRHAAALNFGDCMAYALAKFNDLPLLFKGNDFPQTDIRSALD